jgi:hypothetical protein
MHIAIGARTALSASIRSSTQSRKWVSVFLWCSCLLIATTGCFFHRKTQTPAKQATPPAVVTPDFKAAGKIVVFNNEAKFAIVNFPFTTMPKPDQRLAVYRKGLKVGELRSTAQQKDNNVVADLMTGTAQNGDDVREE